MIAAGALPLLVEVLEKHIANVTICEQAIDALKSIATGREALQQEVLAAGTVPILVKVLEMSKSHENIVQLVKAALWDLLRFNNLTTRYGRSSFFYLLSDVWKNPWRDARISAHETLQILGHNDDGSKSKPISNVSKSSNKVNLHDTRVLKTTLPFLFDSLSHLAYYYYYYYYL